MDANGAAEIVSDVVEEPKDLHGTDRLAPLLLLAMLRLSRNIFRLPVQLQKQVRFLVEGNAVITDGRQPLRDRFGLPVRTPGAQDYQYLRLQAAALDKRLNVSGGVTHVANRRVEQGAFVDNRSSTETVTVTAFNNRYEDFISRQNALSGAAVAIVEEQFGNLDDQTMVGLELENRHVWSDWEVFSSIAWLDARSDSIGGKVPLLAEWTGGLGVDWSHRSGPAELVVHNELVTYGRREPWPDVVWQPGQTRYPPGREPSQAGAFTVWNLNVLYRPLRGWAEGLEGGLGIRNALDRAYYTQRATVPPSDSPTKWDEQYDGRHVRLTARYRLVGPISGVPPGSRAPTGAG